MTSCNHSYQRPVIAKAHNTQYSSNDPTGHAELNLLRKAATKLKTIRFNGYRIVSNAESCPMCASALIRSHIRHFYYGADQEASVDPTISLKRIAKQARRKIYVNSGILKDSCIKQIAEARKKLGK